MFRQICFGLVAGGILIGSAVWMLRNGQLLEKAPTETESNAAAARSLGKVPPWVLSNQDLVRMGSQELLGKPYVASFLFTKCPSLCPMITRQLQKIQSLFQDKKVDGLIVTFTVDPENDTPSVLKDYGQKNGADFHRWMFFSGTQDELRNVVVKGFRQFFGEKIPLNPTLYDIAHSQRLVLVDAEGRFAQFFEAGDQGVAELMNTLEKMSVL